MSKLIAGLIVLVSSLLVFSGQAFAADDLGSQTHWVFNFDATPLNGGAAVPKMVGEIFDTDVDIQGRKLNVGFGRKQEESTSGWMANFSHYKINNSSTSNLNPVGSCMVVFTGFNSSLESCVATGRSTFFNNITITGFEGYKTFSLGSVANNWVQFGMNLGGGLVHVAGLSERHDFYGVESDDGLSLIQMEDVTTVPIEDELGSYRGYIFRLEFVVEVPVPIGKVFVSAGPNLPVANKFAIGAIINLW